MDFVAQIAGPDLKKIQMETSSMGIWVTFLGHNIDLNGLSYFSDIEKVAVPANVTNYFLLTLIVDGVRIEVKADSREKLQDVLIMLKTYTNAGLMA